MKVSKLIFLATVLGFGFTSFQKDDDPFLTKTVREMRELAKQFQATKPEDDSLFSLVYSDAGWFEKEFFKEGDEDAAVFKNAKVRDVIGPIVSGNSEVKIYKVLEKRELPDSCQVRIIWVANKTSQRAPPDIKRTKVESLIRADSIRDAIVSGKIKMEDYVLKFTDDPGSYSNNGNYGWMNGKSGFISELTYVGLTIPVGKTVIIDSAFGYYVVQILKHSESTHLYFVAAKINRFVKR